MPTNITIPAAGESVTTGVISAWRKKTGDYVQRDEVILDVETDKITIEVRAEAAGVLTTSAREGDEVKIGAVVGMIDESAAAPATSAAPAQVANGEAAAPTKPPPAAADPVRATPLARKTAQDLGVDLSRVAGTGAGHRVREQDVVNFASGRAPATSSAGSSTPAPAPAPAPAGSSQARGVSLERMTPLRQRVAARLVEAQQTAAMLTTFNECDMSAVMALRARYKEEFEKAHGVGLGFMSFFVKAAVQALRRFPIVNSYITAGEGGSPMIQKHSYCDIAVAVSSPRGLVVPVVRDAQSLSFAQIESTIKDLASRARDGKLALEDMQGGTFTITNGGIFGSLMSTPILNPPQSAILGMHAIKARPVEDPDKPGQIALRPMMYLALSYDHRLVDGAEAVQFLVAIKNAIEDPRRLMLSL